MGVPEALSERWARMTSALLADDPNWHVWIDWYQDRLAGDGAGRLLDLELEERRVLALSPEDLEQGAAHCNTILARIEAERPVTLAPDPTAGQFRGDESSERISAERLQRDDQLSDGALTEELRQNAAEHAQDLARIASNKRTSNQYDDASLAIPAGRLVDALGDGLAQVQPGRVTGQLIALEVHLKSDTEARKEDDPLDPILSPKAHDALLIAVDTLRILVQTDPHLGMLYGRRREVATPRVDPDQAAAVVEDADTSGIVAEDAITLLQDTAEADRKDPQSTLGARTFANFLRVATKIADWAKRTAPKALEKAKLARAIAKWMIRNETALVTLTAFDPTLQRIVSETIQSLKKLPLD